MVAVRKRNALVYRNILNQKYQFAALTVIIVLGVAVFVSMTVSFHNLGGSYERTYDELGFADFTVRVGQAPQEAVDAIRLRENVAGVEGRVVMDTGLKMPDGSNIHARLIGLPADRRAQVNDIHVSAGSYWGPDDSEGLLASSQFADYFDLEPGDTLTFVTPEGEQQMTVRGTAVSPEYLLNAASQVDIVSSPRRFGVFFLPLHRLQHLFGMDGKFNEIAVRVVNVKERQADIDAVEALLQPHDTTHPVSTITQDDQSSAKALKMDLEESEGFATLLPILVLAVAALSIYITMSRMVQAQRQQIGLFMALGYSRGHVLRHYLAYAAVIALVGSAVGVALGLWLASLLTTTYADALGIPMVQEEFQPIAIVVGVAIASAMALIAGLFPAWRSARMAPSEAMRLDPQIAIVKGSVPVLERAMRPVFTPSMLMRIPLRSIFRSRMRTLYTLAGVVFAFILLLVSLGMFDTIRHTLDVQYKDTELWDVNAKLRATDDTSVWQTVDSWPETLSVERTMEGFAALAFDGKRADVSVMALPKDTQLHRFQMGGSRQDALGDGRIVLTPYTSRETGASEGDRVTLTTPLGEAGFVVSGVSKETFCSGAYVGLDDIGDLLGGAGVYNGLQMKVREGKAETIPARMYELPGIASVNLKDDTIDDWNQFMALFIAMGGVLILFALIIAFAILFNTVTVNVLERQRELATMRTLGEWKGRLALMMVVENLLMGVGAAVPGILLGWAVTYAMMQSMSSDMLNFRAYIAPISYVVVLVGVLLTVVVSVIPAIRRVNRMDLAEVTKVLV